MSRLIGTRIRVETSEHKKQYFPEYCVERRRFWSGKTYELWLGINDLSPFEFGMAHIKARQHAKTLTKEYAMLVIDIQAKYYVEYLKEKQHKERKKVSYIEYPKGE